MKLLWVLLSMSLIAASCRGVGEEPPAPTPLADSATVGGPIIEEPWEFMPQTKVRDLAIGGARPGWLYHRCFQDWDSGVELERVLSDEAVLWRVHVQPFRVEPWMAPGSAYFQKADVRIEGDRVVVDVLGAAHLVEVRDLATGRQISREFPDLR